VAEQGRYTYTLQVDAKQYRRELKEASKVASKLTSDLVAGTTDQRAALKAAAKEVDRTHRRYSVLADAVKNFPNIADRTKDAQFFKELRTEAKNAKDALKSSEQQVNKYAQALSRLSKISAGQFRTAQVAANPKKAEADLAAQNRRTKERILLLNRVSSELRKSKSEQLALNKAGLDTAAVDVRVARLTATHVRLNGALSRGIGNAQRLEKELKDVANIQSRLGSTQYSKPIGPAAPQRGFRGNTGRRAGVGSAFSGAANGAGMAGAAMAGGIAGIAAALAGRAIQLIGDFAKATARYASDAAKAAAETQKLRLALVGTLGAEEAAQGMVTIKEVVKDFNVPFNTATAAFTRFAASAKATGVESNDISQSFKGLIAANKALGGSQDQANGIMLAATQVFGKGKVSAEELRGQIGERLPGAVALFAKSMGRTTAELDKGLEEGIISVEEFVNFSKGLFDQFGEDAKAIGNSSAEAGLRLDNNLKELQRNIGMFLQPLGAEFQKVFSEIVGYINQAIVALSNFLGVGTEGAINKATKEVAKENARMEELKDSVNIAEDGSITGKKGDRGGRKLTAFTQARDRRDAGLARLESLKGKKEGTITRDKMVTSADLQKNRSGSGGGSKTGGANTAADAARRLAKIQAAEARKLARLQISLLDEVFRHRLSVTQQQFAGEKAAQIGILNTYILQNRQLDSRGQKFIEDVKRAQSELEAAEARLAASAGGNDAVRAQGAVDEAREKLDGAQARSGAFQESLPNLQGANALQSFFSSTQASKEASENLQKQAELLRIRNRLEMEGFSGLALEGAVQKAEIDQRQLERIAGINEMKEQGLVTDEYALAMIARHTEAYNAEREAVNGLTEAQLANSGALQEYISGAQEYLNDTQGRIAEIAGTIEQGISSAIMGLVNGTMTATEAFHNFFKSVGQAFLKMAAQMIAKLIIIKLLKTAIGAFGGGGASAGASATDGLTMGASPAQASAIAGGGAVEWNTDMPINGGNIFEEFAKGGIVNGPTAALIGEGGMNEAVVPLPNGKAIPVDMRGASGGNVNSNVTVNVTNDGSSSDSDPNGPAKLGKAIDTAVRKVIMDERRSGGLLSSAR
jgi:tape measure domain-containing protein